MASSKSVIAPIRMLPPVTEKVWNAENTMFNAEYSHLEKVVSTMVFYVNVGPISDDKDFCFKLAGTIVNYAATIVKKLAHVDVLDKDLTKFEYNVPSRRDGETFQCMYIAVFSRQVYNVMTGKDVFSGKARQIPVYYTLEEIEEMKKGELWHPDDIQGETESTKIKTYADAPGYMGKFEVAIPEKLRAKMKITAYGNNYRLVPGKDDDKVEALVPKTTLVNYYPSFASNSKEGVSTNTLHATISKEFKWIKPEMIYSIMRPYSTSTVVDEVKDRLGEKVKRVRYPIVKFSDTRDGRFTMLRVEFDPNNFDAKFAYQMKALITLEGKDSKGKKTSALIVFKYKKVITE